ncbi:DUF4761 domain-containing protein [Symbiopectobacterium purcellii]|uniref:DUF4761 domain-containing protein n=1 Tax=Symbiopectobacterium purcellii TaxID=2871826 RepID=UPI003F86B0A3
MELIQLNEHISFHRGFTIWKLPRKKPYKVRRYQITRGSDYLGLAFSSLEARRIIDEILNHAK